MQFKQMFVTAVCVLFLVLPICCAKTTFLLIWRENNIPLRQLKSEKGGRMNAEANEQRRFVRTLDQVMQHIAKWHMQPIQQCGRSYFLSSDPEHIRALVEETMNRPDFISRHKIKRDRGVKKKAFEMQVGVHGISQAPCYNVTVIFHVQDNVIVTAFPTVWGIFWKIIVLTTLHWKWKYGNSDWDTMRFLNIILNISTFLTLWFIYFLLEQAILIERTAQSVTKLLTTLISPYMVVDSYGFLQWCPIFPARINTWLPRQFSKQWRKARKVCFWLTNVCEMWFRGELDKWSHSLNNLSNCLFIDTWKFQMTLKRDSNPCPLRCRWSAFTNWALKPLGWE